MMASETHEYDANHVEIQQLEAQHIVSIRAAIRIEQLGEAVGDRIQALRDYLQQHDIQPAGPPFVRYYTFGETDTDFEFGVPVTLAVEPLADEGQVTGGELSGGPAVTTWHLGPHNKLGEAYARIDAFINEQGYETDGPAREVYYWMDLSPSQDPSASPSAWRTQLIQPVK